MERITEHVRTGNYDTITQHLCLQEHFHMAMSDYNDPTRYIEMHNQVHFFKSNCARTNYCVGTLTGSGLAVFLTSGFLKHCSILSTFTKYLFIKSKVRSNQKTQREVDWFARENGCRPRQQRFCQLRRPIHYLK